MQALVTYILVGPWYKGNIETTYSGKVLNDPTMNITPV